MALGRSLAIDRQILLLDEPLSNLDAKVRIQLRSEVKALQNRLRFTAIHVTHDREEAMTMAVLHRATGATPSTPTCRRTRCPSSPATRSSGATSWASWVTRATVRGPLPALPRDGPAFGAGLEGVPYVIEDFVLTGQIDADRFAASPGVEGVWLEGLCPLRLPSTRPSR